MFRRTIAVMAIVGGLLAVCGCVYVVGESAAAGDSAATVKPSRWPMQTTTSDGAAVTIFQPQLEDFQGDIISARAAVAVTPANAQQPIFGAIWLQSRVATDRVNRTVQVLDVNVTKVLFPNSQAISTQTLSDAARQAILAEPITLSLDHLLASLEAIQKAQTAAADLQTAPPAIVFRDHPAMKVQYDGPAKLQQVENSNLMRVVNTPFFVALDPSTRTYFLKGAGHWFAAPDPMGPFQYATQIPQAVAQLADQSGYSDPQQPIPDDEVSRLEIVTATDPTELIWTDGPPQMSTIPGTGLLYWANTDSDVFLQIGTQQTFVLLSGRWYTASSPNGPWTYVPPDHLPDDFAKIPADSPKANVLACVAGTQQAQDAIADTYIPQTAAVDCNNYDQPPVDYDGDPDFQPIEGTNCSYAMNTDCSVVYVGGTYYCCYNAVWYQCDQPCGRWIICRRVPRDIYTIPPSCPIYPVRFVYIYGYSQDVIYVGYTPGYVGCYPSNGVVVYGTGYRYEPWFHQRYVPRPNTFGFAAKYHPYTGRWGFGFGLASGGGQTWIAANPKEHHEAGWFGCGGYRPSQAPATLRINRTIIDANNVKRQTYEQNVYQRRGDLHPEAPGVTPHKENPPKENPPRENPPKPTPQPVVHDDLKNNDVYVNQQGDVYRHTDAGWEKRAGDQWKPQSPPPPNPVHPAKAQPESPAPPNPGHPPKVQPESPTPPAGEKQSNNEKNENSQKNDKVNHESPPPPPPPPRNNQENNKAEPRNQPKANPDQGAPEQDYRARQQGEQRGHAESPPPPPPPPPPHNEPRPTPHNNPPPPQKSGKG